MLGQELRGLLALCVCQLQFTDGDVPQRPDNQPPEERRQHNDQQECIRARSDPITLVVGEDDRQEEHHAGFCRERGQQEFGHKDGRPETGRR